MANKVGFVNSSLVESLTYARVVASWDHMATTSQLISCVGSDHLTLPPGKDLYKFMMYIINIKQSYSYVLYKITFFFFVIVVYAKLFILYYCFITDRLNYFIPITD